MSSRKGKLVHQCTGQSNVNAGIRVLGALQSMHGCFYSFPSGEHGQYPTETETGVCLCVRAHVCVSVCAEANLGTGLHIVPPPPPQKP